MSVNIKQMFPFIVNNPKIIYLDSAATSLKLIDVIESEKIFLTYNGMNPHAVDYEKGYETYERINQIRSKVMSYINAYRKEEIIFTSGTTHSINLLANGLDFKIEKDDEILLTELEHSANMLPWINLANNCQAFVKKIKLNEDFSINMKWLEDNISSKTKIITLSHMTNTIGNVNDIKKICGLVKKINSKTIIHVDCAQSIAHEQIDVKTLNADFISWSAHKMYGPFGLGVLWGRFELLNQLKPIFYGGGMSLKIHENLITYTLNELPEKLEGGTPNVSAILAFEKAIDFVNKIGINIIKAHEKGLKHYFIDQVNNSNLKTKIVFYNLNNDSPIILFNVNGVNPQDITSFLDKKYNISVRGGANCARRIEGVIKTQIAIRASLGIYNTKSDIDTLIMALKDCDNFLETII